MILIPLLTVIQKVRLETCGNMLIFTNTFFLLFLYLVIHFSGLLILGVPSDTICCIWIGVCCFMQDYSAMIMIPTSLWSRTVSSIFEMPTWEKQTLADWWDDWNSSVRKVAYHGPLRKTTRGSAFGADITLRSSWYISVLCWWVQRLCMFHPCLGRLWRKTEMHSGVFLKWPMGRKRSNCLSYYHHLD